MDEKQYRENQSGYDKDTFGEVNKNRYAGSQSGAQGVYSQNAYSHNAQQTPPPDGGSFYHSSSQSDGNGLGIASMVLGILALVFFCGCINIPLAIISIILAIIQLSRRGEGKGFAIAGIVTSAISVILMILAIIVLYIGGVSTTLRAYTMPFEYFMDDDDYYDDYYDDYDYGDHSHDLSADGGYRGRDL